MGKSLKDEWKNNREFRQLIVVFCIMMEAALFERFFIPYEIKTAYYGYISVLNTAVHLVILYPLLYCLYKLFFKKRK